MQVTSHKLTFQVINKNILVEAEHSERCRWISSLDIILLILIETFYKTTCSLFRIIYVC